MTARGHGTAVDGSIDVEKFGRQSKGQAMIARMSAHSPGDTSAGPVFSTACNPSSSAQPCTEAMAAAATHGERLIPAPQQTSVGVPEQERPASVSKTAVSRQPGGIPRSVDQGETAVGSIARQSGGWYFECEINDRDDVLRQCLPRRGRRQNGQPTADSLQPCARFDNASVRATGRSQRAGTASIPRTPRWQGSSRMRSVMQ